MNTKTKQIILAILIVGIAGTIWFIESHKPKKTDTPIDSVAVRDATEKASLYPTAKELSSPQGFINTEEFKIADMIGKKVILVDFWTYSCINCQRTTPYLIAWYDKYKDQGLEIIGVHTPEFDFEKKYDNVARAVKEMGIKYPVVLDNNYGTWNAYENRYWPRKYLIDIDGYIVYDHIGEGGYDETEKAIQNALEERKQKLNLDAPITKDMAKPSGAISMDQAQVKSPEVYFGADRNEFLGNGRRGVVGSQTFTLPATTNLNTLYLQGTWNITKESARSVSQSAKVVFKYSSKNVYFVASSEKSVKIKVLRDGVLINTFDIKDNKLYTLIGGQEYGEHTLEIIVDEPGLEVFTFTFG